jgi:hypothetical protein
MLLHVNSWHALRNFHSRALGDNSTHTQPAPNDCCAISQTQPSPAQPTQPFDAFAQAAPQAHRNTTPNVVMGQNPWVVEPNSC